jgi:APA family basic amino acid/polyamine antiporter
LSRKPGRYPVVPLVFIIASLAIVVNQFVSTPLEAAIGLGVVALGVPVYYWIRPRAS